MKICLTVLLLIVAAVIGFAQVELYDNGPTNGTTDGWTINFGFAVSDSFTLGAASNVSAVAFALWLFPGDVLTDAEVSITSEEFGGSTYFDGTVNFTQSGCVGNQYGYNVCSEQGSFSDVSLGPGSYWLTLQNANVANGDPVYWDENSGPSQASQNAIGTIPSESFTVFGNNSTTCTCCAASPNCGIPEPSTISTSVSGALAMFGLVGAFRRRHF
jgi:hypothetical protein